MRAGWRLAAVALALSMAPSISPAADLPDGFVYLSDVAPHIRQDIRYAGKDNFTGAPVPGYGAAECVLAEPAAQALSAIADELAAKGFGLKVLDCYRPVKAVDHFMAWARAAGGTDPDHFPHIDRKRLVAEGYIARRSGHSGGFAVDLTLTGISGAELDMGTPFDFFDPLAHTSSRQIGTSAVERRRILVAAMTAGGFSNYSREWWHFSLRQRRAQARSHDFDIVKRGG